MITRKLEANREGPVSGLAPTIEAAATPQAQPALSSAAVVLTQDESPQSEAILEAVGAHREQIHTNAQTGTGRACPNCTIRNIATAKVCVVCGSEMDAKPGAVRATGPQDPKVTPAAEPQVTTPPVIPSAPATKTGAAHPITADAEAAQAKQLAEMKEAEEAAKKAEADKEAEAAKVEAAEKVEAEKKAAADRTAKIEAVKAEVAAKKKRGAETQAETTGNGKKPPLPMPPPSDGPETHEEKAAFNRRDRRGLITIVSVASAIGILVAMVVTLVFCGKSDTGSSVMAKTSPSSSVSTTDANGWLTGVAVEPSTTPNKQILDDQLAKDLYGQDSRADFLWGKPKKPAKLECDRKAVTLCTRLNADGDCNWDLSTSTCTVELL